ncbi:hypothetical protein RAS12_29645 [Achromobacter seleniivolatilans]|uniref:Uncharacterized protein n=1 Tax=Achromobacter seleniivolatilans TaxID=3047478 RepID=A0ABY9M150_9BURK|nr:hypothetical protein [Achromobacter sp. R39]WMD20705.1 hypothetical protein RAS12_29645 [Achromobacter sp. R39]
MQRRPLLVGLGCLLIAPLGVNAAPGNARMPDRNAIIRQVYALPPEAIAFTPQHAALIRLLVVQWLPIESGAPGVDFEQPLHGGRDTMANARNALHTQDDALAIRRLAEVCRLIPRYVRQTGKLEPGRYAVPAELRDALSFPASGVDTKGEFTLLDTHIKLLRSLNWREVDARSLESVLHEGDRFWPMPYVDGKRPYGNSAFYQIDMANVLGEPYRLDAKGYAVTEPAKDARLARLHQETLAALQVFLAYSSATAAKR